MEIFLPSSTTGGDILLSLSIMDLPTPIFVDILLKVSVERIIDCKCVCKAWYKIISDPQFVKLYFARGDVYPLVRPLHPSHVSRILYFIDPKYCTRDSTSSSLKTKFKIPLHKPEVLFERLTQGKRTEESGVIQRKRLLRLKPGDHNYRITNSCKGILCLSKGDIVKICNPITGEYVNLPTNQVPQMVEHVLGFSPRSNNYKVLRMFGHSTEKWWIHRPTKRVFQESSSYAQIQLLGSRSWKDIGLAPQTINLHFPTFLNGTLNWVFIDSRGPRFIACFDFDSHHFGSILLPMCAGGAAAVKLNRNMRIGVLRNKLCSCIATIDNFLHIWVMSEYGAEGTWTKVFSVRLPMGIYAGFYQPINQLENGAILFFHRNKSKRSGFIYYDPETEILKYLSLFTDSSARYFEAIAFIPSFTLLKDVLVGNEVEVLNVNSRCGDLKIPKESSDPYLRGSRMHNNI